MTSGDGRQGWMDGLRGWAILGVIWLHAVDQALALGDDLPIATALADAAGPFRMPVLMGLSGALLHRSLSQPTRAYFGAKLRSLAWPYALWSVALLALAGAEPGEFLKIVYAPPTYLWFLAYLLVFQGISWVLPPRARTALAPVAMCVAAWTGAALPFLLAAFLVGDATGRHAARLVPLVRRGRIVAAAWAVTLAGACASATGTDLRYHPVSALCVVGAAVALGDLLHRLPSRGMLAVVETIGRHSIVFYVSHYVVTTLTFIALVAAGVTEPRLVLAAAFCAALATGMLLVRLRPVAAIGALWTFPVAHAVRVPVPRPAALRERARAA